MCWLSRGIGTVNSRSNVEDVGHAIVDTLPLYETDLIDVTEAVDLKKFRELGADAIIFTSSSTALSYIEQEDDLVLDQEAIKRSFAVLVLRPANSFGNELTWNWSVPTQALRIYQQRLSIFLKF